MNQSEGLTLVTGGTGHLGQDIVKRLLRSGRRVRVLARSPPPSGLDVDWAIGDLATGAGLAPALDGAHTVINAATYSPSRSGAASGPSIFSNLRQPWTWMVPGGCSR